jgi:hypothetical protein
MSNLETHSDNSESMSLECVEKFMLMKFAIIDEFQKFARIASVAPDQQKKN